MRIALAKLLLEKPNLLLLDEPTNHLDLEARNWLEEYLTGYPNAFVLISHDRYFLDMTVDRILEIWNKTAALLQRQLREVSGSRRASGKRSWRRPSAISRSGSSSSKRSSAGSAIRRRKRNRCRAASRNWRRSTASNCRPTSRPSTSLFRSRKPSGRIVAEFTNVSKSYGDEAVLRDVEFHHRARRPHRPGGHQRRGQVDVDQTARGRGAFDRRRIHAGTQRRTRLLRPGSVQGARSERAMIDDLGDGARRTRPN